MTTPTRPAKTAAKKTPGAPFEFLNPLDGETYTLPPYDKSLFVDKLVAHKDELSPIPTLYEVLSGDDPKAYKNALDARESDVVWLRMMSMVAVLDAHIPAPDDPAKNAIIASLNGGDFAFLFKLVGEWALAAGEQVEDKQGEG